MSRANSHRRHDCRAPSTNAPSLTVVTPPHSRSNEWWHRQSFSRYGVRLGWGEEHWDLEADHYEGALALRQRLRDLGRRSTKHAVALDLADFLLSDVLVAAGGVERAVGLLRQAKAGLSQLADQLGLRGTPEVPRPGLGDAGSIDAAYAFADFLSWVRALDERLDRRACERGVKRRQGLLPALRPKRLTSRVHDAIEAFRAGPGGSCRDLANFTLHTSLVRNPWSGVVVDESGVITLPIPDTPARAVYHWYLLTWSGDRDGFAFAEQVWSDVQKLTDDLLAAFEKAVPKRMRLR